jgi:histidyl-tRNA synthetase
MAQGALPGFRDFYPEQFAERAYVQNVWRDVARRFAFVEYDGPPLETLDLYTKKSGEEIVGQLYNFVDKGGREIALRPEMTPTLARMAAAKANALRKPVRWFSAPQLFRYERQQKGRLREHFQLNVDIIGEADVTADAELLAVAIEVMRECGLTPADVRARVSDRRLLRALLRAVGVADDRVMDVFGVIDKFERRPTEASREALGKLMTDAGAIERVLAFANATTIDALDAEYGSHADVRAALDELRRYHTCLESLGVADWVSLDLTIVRGLAYYTGIVFELFDAKGDFRAICGGGRYDTLLQSLGGVDLPALGFGMGDVVLTELLRERGLLQERAGMAQPDFWVAGSSEAQRSVVAAAATALRRAGASVEYALREQSPSKQRKASHSAGATYFVTLADDFADSHRVTVEPFAETASPTLAGLLGEEPYTLDHLVSAVREHPQLLSSTL